MMYKTNDSIICIQAEATKPIYTNIVFWSHDRGTAKLRFKLMKENTPLSLAEGTTVPIRLRFKSETAEGGYGKHDYLATIEDRVNGIVSIVLEDNILGYVGKVEGSVYIDFPNDRSLDTAGRFTFYIKRSPIDDSTPELEDYYFNGFSQNIDKIEKILADRKLEIDQKIAESETQIDGKLKDTNDKITKANQDIAALNTNIDKANDCIDQTNQQIGDLGKLKKMYSNSIDFGDYDYSGNPNLLSTITSDYFTTKDNVTIANENRGVKLTFRNSGFGAETGNVVQIKPKTTYTLSAKVTVNEDFVGDLSKIRLTYRKFPGGNILLGTNLSAMLAGETKIISVTGSVVEMKQVERTYLRLDSNSQIVDGSINIEYIKLEEASIATPYQPNLFEKPWQISKISLNENLANQSVVFPINTSTYNLYAAKMKKKLEIGKNMTITLKGTKPVNQSFKLFGNGSIDYGTLTPVTGLVDTWRLTFTPNEVATANPSNIELYQVPKNTLGNCTIEWLKIEEGDVATPNITDYKYFGEGLKDSDNPNDYSWNITPEYTENIFAKEDCVVHNSGNESIDGFKDFRQIPTVKGVNLAKETFGITLTGGQLSGVELKEGTILKWGTPYSYDNERSRNNDLFTISSNLKTLTILKECTLQFIGKFTCQTNSSNYYAYLELAINGGDKWRAAGVAGSLNWRNDVGWFMVRKFMIGDKVTLITGTNYTSSSVNAWGVDQVHIQEVIKA